MPDPKARTSKEILADLARQLSSGPTDPKFTRRVLTDLAHVAQDQEERLRALERWYENGIE